MTPHNRRGLSSPPPPPQAQLNLCLIRSHDRQLLPANGWLCREAFHVAGYIVSNVNLDLFQTANLGFTQWQYHYDNTTHKYTSHTIHI
jgi:hypothetical protein